MKFVPKLVRSSAYPVFSGLVLATLVSACASGMNAKEVSLAKRGYELSDEQLMQMRDMPLDQTSQAAAAPPAPFVLPSAGSSRLISSMSQYRSGASAYANKLAATQQLVERASGAAVGSESWVQAHQAISRLDSARMPCLTALGDLDKLYTELMEQYGLYGTGQVNLARNEVSAGVERQNNELANMTARLKI